MSRVRRVIPWEHINEPRKVNNMDRVDVVTAHNMYRHVGSMENIKKIYKFLVHSSSGLTEFCNYLKEKYPDAVTRQGEKVVYVFNTDILMMEFWNNEKMRPEMEAGCFDDFSRLQYWAAKEAK